MRFNPLAATGRVLTDAGDPYGEDAKEWFESEGAAAWRVVKRIIKREEEGKSPEEKLRVRQDYTWSRLQGYGLLELLPYDGGLETLYLFNKNAVRISDTATTPFDPLIAEGFIFDCEGQPFGGAVKAWFEGEGQVVWTILRNCFFKKMNVRPRNRYPDWQKIYWNSLRFCSLRTWLEWDAMRGIEAYHIFHPRQQVSVKPSLISPLYWLHANMPCLRQCLPLIGGEQHNAHEQIASSRGLDKRDDTDGAVYVQHQPGGRVRTAREGQQIRRRLADHSSAH